MKNIIVLGAGMVGAAMAIDLAKKHKVTLTDINQERLDFVKNKCAELAVMELDVTNADKFNSIIKTYDLVICAVPGFLGFQTLRHILEAGKNVIDISFFPENSL